MNLGVSAQIKQGTNTLRTKQATVSNNKVSLEIIENFLGKVRSSRKYTLVRVDITKTGGKLKKLETLDKALRT